MSEVLSSLDSGKPQANLSQSPSSSVHSERNQCKNCGQALRPGELACSKCGKMVQTQSEAKLQTNHLDETQGGFECPSCQTLCLPGSLVCVKCGTSFVVDDNTYNLDRREMQFPFAWDKTTAISVDFDEPIFFEIEGQTLRLPIDDMVEVGRLPIASGETGQLPYLSLALFGAHEKGVSRQHIIIIRKHELVYVRDVGSRNGTMHNGKFLVTNSPQVLRSGDELRLGTLVIRVRFQTSAGPRHDLTMQPLDTTNNATKM